MDQEHEYALLGGFNRSSIGRYLTLIAALLSSLATLIILAVIDMATMFGWSRNIPPVLLVPITGGVIYAGLYWIFSRHIWRIPALATLLRVPNLAGTWDCVGAQLDPTTRTVALNWQAEIVIVQDWDKIRLRLQTKQSISNSETAALVYDKAAGYRLLYTYFNKPGINQANLHAHRGYSEILFAEDLKSATGEYFNGITRFTFGTLTLTRKQG